MISPASLLPLGCFRLRLRVLGIVEDKSCTCYSRYISIPANLKYMTNYINCGDFVSG